MDRLIKIDGIYRFCIDNRDSICHELNTIPKGTIVNYSDNDKFSIVNSHSIKIDDNIDGCQQLGVQTHTLGSNSAQRHTYVCKDDSIIVVNESWVVRKTIIDFFMRHKRQEIINNILS